MEENFNRTEAINRLAEALADLTREEVAAAHESRSNAPAVGYRDFSGQAVEFPTYRFNGAEAEFTGMQALTFPASAFPVTPQRAQPCALLPDLDRSA